MPLWLDLLRTPMAAPETAGLRRLRRLWQGLCLVLAGAILLVRPICAARGRAGPCLLAALLGATLLATALYLWRKHRADSAFLESLKEEA